MAHPDVSAHCSRSARGGSGGSSISVRSNAARRAVPTPPPGPKPAHRRPQSAPNQRAPSSCAAPPPGGADVGLPRKPPVPLAPAKARQASARRARLRQARTVRRSASVGPTSQLGRSKTADAKEGVYQYSPGTSHELNIDGLMSYLGVRLFFDSKVTPDLARAYLTSLAESGTEALLVARAPGVLKQVPDGVSFVQFASLIRWSADVWKISYAECLSKLFSYRDSVRQRLGRLFGQYSTTTTKDKKRLMTLPEYKKLCEKFGLVGPGKLAPADLHMINMACGAKQPVYGNDGYKLNVQHVAIDFKGFLRSLDIIAERLRLDSGELRQVLAVKAEVLKVIPVVR